LLFYSGKRRDFVIILLTALLKAI